MVITAFYKCNIVECDDHLVTEFIQETNMPIYLEPEFMTSQHAEVMQEKRELLDASAAALILQRFLDKRNN